jgi:glycosyltransferase involved in cell wall biosynthesis
MLLLIHNNPVGIDGGVLRVDRKFHDGMLNYVRHIRAPITTVHPLAAPGSPVMDPVTLPLAELPYRVVGIPVDRRGKVTRDGGVTLDAAVAASKLVVGYGYGSAEMAQRHRKRFVACLEYDLETQLVVVKSFARDPVRSLLAQARCRRDWRREMVPAMRSAWQIHCNGYPMYHASEAFNPKRLLYFDSRMSRDMVIADGALEQRLRARADPSAPPGTGRPTRLVYSGRYESMKGALDAVQAAAACRAMGLDVTMDTWGQGSQAAAMREVAAASGGAIRVHDAIPFPELVKKTHDADVFVCCHIQSDPSCTYLESMGAGLPIVGYANRMWRSMAKDSGAGVVSDANTPASLAHALVNLLKAPGAVEDCSRRARAFAAAHAFEVEFARRTDAINEALEGA